MCARQVTRAHQEFMDDLAAGKAEGFTEKLGPGRCIQRMHGHQPLFKRSMLLLKPQYRFCIFYSGIDLKPVTDDAAVG